MSEQGKPVFNEKKKKKIPSGGLIGWEVSVGKIGVEKQRYGLQ